MVYLNLIVSRKSLEVFASESPDTIGAPALLLSVTQDTPGYAYETLFHSIHRSFGAVKSDSVASDSVDIAEDTRGWMGDANLLVTCQVPSLMPREAVV